MGKISSIEVCNRMNKGRLLHHPARSKKKLELFERVERVNPETFVGILVITEYLSKYSFAVPFRSKQAFEIKDTYISIFGPPKIILNDNFICSYLNLAH
jgi:hypothetical protein